MSGPKIRILAVSRPLWANSVRIVMRHLAIFEAKSVRIGIGHHKPYAIRLVEPGILSLCVAGSVVETSSGYLLLNKYVSMQQTWLTDVKPTVGPGQPRIANVGSADPAEGGRPRSTDINPRQQTGSIKARNAVGLRPGPKHHYNSMIPHVDAKNTVTAPAQKQRGSRGASSDQAGPKDRGAVSTKSSQSVWDSTVCHKYGGGTSTEEQAIQLPMIKVARTVVITFALTVSISAVELQGGNPGFSNPGIQGCISAPTKASGAPLVIHNCNTQPAVNQDWKLNFFTKENAGPEQIRIFGNKICSFINNVNQKWEGAPNPDAVTLTSLRPASLIVGGDPSAGGGGPYCIAAASDSDGAEVALVACSEFTTFPNGNATWTAPVAPLTGQLKTFNNKYLDITWTGFTHNLPPDTY
ncbi:hypothetical protein B0H13DRAFT_1928229 [Mycena leptocephala]|nr:hypothetical protein B0H13DRAFT_1928229 [Mycena leptocephala]